MSPPRITELFARWNEPPYNLSHNAEFLQPFANALHHGTESISYSDRPKDLGYVFRCL